MVRKLVLSENVGFPVYVDNMRPSIHTFTIGADESIGEKEKSSAIDSFLRLFKGGTKGDMKSCVTSDKREMSAESSETIIFHRQTIGDPLQDAKSKEQEQNKDKNVAGGNNLGACVTRMSLF